jgi:DNA invertase Pin-like site-specific DNA recombinase
LNKNNIAIRKDYKKILKKEKNDKIIKLYVAEKITVKNIANSFGIEITTIKRILKENNIKIFDDKEKHYSEVSDDTLLRLYNDGLSYSKIARTVQIHRTTVKNRLIKLGVL